MENKRMKFSSPTQHIASLSSLHLFHPVRSLIPTERRFLLKAYLTRVSSTVRPLTLLPRLHQQVNTVARRQVIFGYFTSDLSEGQLMHAKLFESSLTQDNELGLMTLPTREWEIEQSIMGPYRKHDYIWSLKIRFFTSICLIPLGLKFDQDWQWWVDGKVIGNNFVSILQRQFDFYL